MSEAAWEFVGWAGQALFFSRFLVQWLASEKAGASVVPGVFWVFSLAGTVLSGLYAWLGKSHDMIFATSYAFNFLIYSRNLVLVRRPSKGLPASRMVLLSGLALLLLIWLLLNDRRLVEALGERSPAWLLVGVTGQLIWSSRFLLQWVQSEQSGRAHLSRSFFWVSLVGSVLLLAYSLYLRNWVFFTGLILTPLVSIRNLMLSGRLMPRTG